MKHAQQSCLTRFIVLVSLSVDVTTARLLMGITLGLISCGNSTTLAYVIQFSQNTGAGKRHFSTTASEGRYRLWENNGWTNFFVTPPAGDRINDDWDRTFQQITKFNSKVVKVSDIPDMPVWAFDTAGDVATLLVTSKELSTGYYASGQGRLGNNPKTVGTARQQFNLSGTFTVVPEQGEAAKGFVDLQVAGYLDGRIQAKPQTFMPVTSKMSGSMSIQGVGEWNAGGTTTTEISDSTGVDVTVSKDPSFSLSASRTTQQTPQLVKSGSATLVGKIPVNMPITWTVTMDLSVKNEDFLFGWSAGTSNLTIMYMDLQIVDKSFKATDPFYSEALTRFDHNTGEITIVHPLATQSPMVDEVTNRGESQPEPPDYSAFLPEIEVVIDETGNIAANDALAGSVLHHSGITLASDCQLEPQCFFNPGTLEFFGESNTRRATANLENIVANKNLNTFTADIINFQRDIGFKEPSRLADLLATEGGLLRLDPRIITFSNSFTESATSVPYTMEGAAFPIALLGGDSDQDFDFDQIDLVQVQIAAKYLTGEAATWGEGDWDGAPGGSPGNPPPGNGLFDQLDIIAALTPGHYLTGPYAALQPRGQHNDGQISVVYDASTGEVAVDTPAGTELTSINIDSIAGIFTGNAAENLGGNFDNDADNNIFKATFGGSFGSISFGIVAQTGLSKDVVIADLTVVGSLQGGGALGDVDLIYVPEPSTLMMLVVAAMSIGCKRR